MLWLETLNFDAAPHLAGTGGISARSENDAKRGSPVRIAQIAPLVESVPPRLYGGTERVVSWLTEEPVYQGHDVTLFASGGSLTRAELHAVVPRALRLRRNGAGTEMAILAQRGDISIRIAQ
jgi:hypothetical protein